MGTTDKRMREFLESGVEARFHTAIAPHFQGRFTQWLDQDLGPPLGDLARLAFIRSVDLQNIPEVLGELNHVQGNVGVRGAQKIIADVLSPADFTPMSPLCASLHEALPQFQG